MSALCAPIAHITRDIRRCGGRIGRGLGFCGRLDLDELVGGRCVLGLWGRLRLWLNLCLGLGWRIGLGGIGGLRRVLWLRGHRGLWLDRRVGLGWRLRLGLGRRFC